MHDCVAVYLDITYSLLPGHPTPLPAWPMRVACEVSQDDSGMHRPHAVPLAQPICTLRITLLAVVYDNNHLLSALTHGTL